MITGIQSIDSGWQDTKKSIIASVEKQEQIKKELMLKIKNANIKEKELLIFNAFFNGLIYIDETELKTYLKKHPFIFDKLWHVIEHANEARGHSSDACYNRNKCCIEVMNIYKSLLDKMSKLAKELNVSNSLELSILFSYLLWNGYLSKTKKHEFKANNKDEIVGLQFIDITNGKGVCRNYSEMLKDFLNNNGYNSVILANYLYANIKVDYRMNIDGRKLYQMSDMSESISFKKKKANHAFNLIDDKGLYIYDPTNLLIYDLKNRNTAKLVNGKGKNIIYPFISYGFCYSKSDEQLLDKIFTEDSFTSPYNKTDFISTAEVYLELLKNNTSLLEDFYTEAKSDIDGISEETKKVLTRIR